MSPKMAPTGPLLKPFVPTKRPNMGRTWAQECSNSAPKCTVGRSCPDQFRRTQAQHSCTVVHVNWQSETMSTYSPKMRERAVPERTLRWKSSFSVGASSSDLLGHRLPRASAFPWWGRNSPWLCAVNCMICGTFASHVHVSLGCCALFSKPQWGHQTWSQIFIKQTYHKKSSCHVCWCQRLYCFYCRKVSTSGLALAFAMAFCRTDNSCSHICHTVQACVHEQAICFSYLAYLSVSKMYMYSAYFMCLTW